MFRLTLLVLTLAMILVHIGEWILLGRLARGSPRSPVARVMGLMNFLRFEAVYYVALLAFWSLEPGVVPTPAVLFLATIHVSGWAFLEAKKTLPRLEEVAMQASTGSKVSSSRRGLRRVLTGIAAFDLMEVVVLAWLALRFWRG